MYKFYLVNLQISLSLLQIKDIIKNVGLKNNIKLQLKESLKLQIKLNRII